MPPLYVFASFRFDSERRMFVLHHSGASVEAIAAARRAVSLETDNWRHHLRLAYVSWGEERLRAAQRTLGLMPGLALAHWLAATVHVARRANVVPLARWASICSADSWSSPAAKKTQP